MKLIGLSFTFLAALIFVNAHDVFAAPAPYTLKMTNKNRFMQLINTKSRRVVWTQLVEGAEGETHWSKDGRAVAVEMENKVFVWREGEKLHRLLVPDARAYKYTRRVGLFDYAMGCIWSPDNERLLVRFGGSASTDIGPNGVGTLFILRLKRGQAPQYFALPSIYDVWKMGWRDNQTALYWPYLDTGIFPTDVTDNGKKPRLWRVP